MDRAGRQHLGARTFHPADQDAFAALSGDVNPLHVDDLAARRALFGQVVVHGVHAALWAVDLWCAHHPDRAPVRLAASFRKPVFLAETVDAVLVSGTDERAQINVERDGVVLAAVTLSHEAGTAPGDRTPAERPRPDLLRAPAELSLADMADRAGELHVVPDEHAWRAAFGHLCDAIGPEAAAQVGALSYLVGMVCPGAHSLFGGFDVALRASGDGVVRWHVVMADPRVSIVRMDVDGGRVHGTVSAFARPAPTPQPSFDDVRTSVGPAEFATVRALVVGGSRGLGELAAKLIAAGGGTALITYRAGADDAAAVASEIRAGGGDADAVRLDTEADDVSVVGGRDLTHLLYFASPRITTRRLRPFEADRFAEFTRVYVDGFLRVADAAAASGPLTVVYPSTVYVTDPRADLVEYIAAKAAGEAVAACWAAGDARRRVLVERLPRVATDQTATLVVGDRPAPPVPVVLDVLRRMMGPEPGATASVT